MFKILGLKIWNFYWRSLLLKKKMTQGFEGSSGG